KATERTAGHRCPTSRCFGDCGPGSLLNPELFVEASRTRAAWTKKKNGLVARPRWTLGRSLRLRVSALSSFDWSRASRKNESARNDEQESGAAREFPTHPFSTRTPELLSPSTHAAE